MTIPQMYSLWLEKTADYEDLQLELISISQNPEQQRDRFYKNLEFGTGGLRGVIGAGTNRMNIFTVAKATRGLAAYLTENGGASCSIAYDSRNKSDEFAKIAACVLANAGVKVYIYSELMPTPMLSFAVRKLKCSAGIVITASHNPAIYNGYKVYGADGCQLTLKAAEHVLQYINKMDCFDEMQEGFESLCKNGKIEFINDDIINAYYKCVLNESVTSPKAKLKIVYSPLNGAGNKPVRHILSQRGVDVLVVAEQENPDGNFPTCPYPNPEIAETMRLACEKMIAESADFCIATDPDCDRVGVALKNIDGSVRLISGNEMGAMLLEYICEARKENGTMPQKPVAVKTIVTTPLAQKIADSYGVELRNVLTGFKFIGEQIAELEEKGEENRYIFGFEESYGYLSGSYVRDKDAVDAAMLICEMAGYYKDRNKTLLSVLEDIYKKYGYCKSDLLTFEFLGEAGMKDMDALLDSIREKNFNIFKEISTKSACDYLNHDTGLPKSNVIAISFADGSHIVIRPSGTEPKLKIYTTVFGKTQEDTKALLSSLNESCKGLTAK